MCILGGSILVNRVIFNVGFYKLAGLGLTFLFTIFMTRYFDSDVSGRYFQFVASVSLISTAIGSALQNFSLKKVSYLHDKGRTIDHIIFLSMAILSLSVFLIFVFLYFFDFSNDFLLFESVVLSIASIISTILLLTSVGFLRGVGDINSSQIVENVVKPILFLLCALLMLNKVIFSYELIYLFSVGLCAIIVVCITFNKIPLPKVIEIKSSSFDIKSSVKDIMDMLVLSTISAFQKNLDIIIVGFFLSSSDVSYYKLPVVCSTLITLGVLISNYYYSREISIAHHSGSCDELQSLVYKGSKLSFYSGLIILGVLIFVAPFIFFYSYSSEWILAYKLFLILSLGKLADSYFGSITTFANMTGNSKIVSMSMLISLSIMFVFSMLFSQLYGLFGVAISVSFSFFIWNLLASYMLRNKTNIKFGVY